MYCLVLSKPTSFSSLFLTLLLIITYQNQKKELDVEITTQDLLPPLRNTLIKSP